LARNDLRFRPEIPGRREQLIAPSRDEAFRFDADRLRRYQLEEFGTVDMGLSAAHEGGLAGGIARRILEAREAGAIGAPEDVELVAYAADDHVFLMVRESKVNPAAMPFTARYRASLWRQGI
jgi:hypothetical protein